MLFPVEAPITVRAVLPGIPPDVAVMVAVPAATAVASPLALTVAAEVLDELQVDWVVISWLVPSENVPEAANCNVFPTCKVGLAGVTDTEDRTAGVTVRTVLPGMPPDVAVMFAVPVATAVAKPLLLTVATGVLDELQVTCAVISCVVLSEYVPMAESC